MTDFRALCAELAVELERCRPLAEVPDCLARARAALAAEADGPAVPEGREPASVVGEPSDEEIMGLMPISFRITMGALSDPLEEQLNNQGLTLGDDAEWLEKDATAISRLRIRGLITESESDKARKRLMKSIKQAVKPLAALAENTTLEADK